MKNFLCTFLVLPVLFVFGIKAQTVADPALLAEINWIKAIDNHAHAMSATRSDGKEDDEYDAIACGKLEFVSAPPVRLRPDNPIYTGAWNELYGYKHGESMNEKHVAELLEIKRRVIRERGDNYPVWVLDKLNIETMLVNRVSAGRGLSSPRFRWVAYGDPLMLPLGTKQLRQANSDKRFFYEQEEMLLKRNLAELGINSLPPTLDLYLSRVVTPTLEKQKREGAIAVKFVAAYLRPLDFADVPKNEAERVFVRFARGAAEPAWNDYKKLQDFLFRYIAREAGRLGLVVHLHTGGGGHFFNLSGSNPLLLESVLNDPTLRKTNFVLVHGGYPFVKRPSF